MRGNESTLVREKENKMLYLVKMIIRYADNAYQHELGLLKSEEAAYKWLYDTFEEYSRNGYICFQSDLSIRCEKMDEKRIVNFVVKRVDFLDK